MHTRNIHRQGYDFKQLVSVYPALSNHIVITQRGQQSIDFSNQTAVITLNQALLKLHYGIDFWTVPNPFLCPPIPGRVDYIHHLAEFLEIQPDFHSHDKVKGLDIGTGASAIYPILGLKCYSWQFVGSDINKDALKLAKQWSEFNNLGLKFRHQPNGEMMFDNIIKPGEQFTFTMCNPPFHASAQEAQAGTERKWRNLKGKTQSNLNFGGHAPELWCEGGELTFIKNMISESQQYSEQVNWFTSLVSKSDHLNSLEKHAKDLGVTNWKVVDMEQGSKQSRFVAWNW
ncbi:23S rRNA (adenine(1618)-N(6))-methyltransferase RlmF (plasmid) [Pseudoalteromonas xiamenensis]|uniref:23S rRNA (adenine(1618)-N(6))-methyltransferase RlmF n=1 Tax=Pseudoalteromonas xiamenensis TaxID=882626 RepID=UPI0027E57D8D|nr:23S rRNA (adenine(1618)-N(6))-methyltransferase RlmF [Pseudoalteromonas xiamenensis]WMN61537.1 23S rRNA (adenine(1618)-N(6))-methyltransferase RlmF [Pseudoalteromonas xiamenensis]WMN62245.1 23S rRNA (adenine(1618)-N(6))-methyltransferase RlmF [Pseudoalteromonas xiamenensis]